MTLMKKVYARNRKAKLNYEFEDTLEAGISLKGSEVKSIRQGRINISDAYVAILNGEAYLMNAHISPYQPAGINNHEPLRERKLLLKRREIDKLAGRVQQKGYTLIPLTVYDRNGKIKVEIALAKGRKKHEKKEMLKERDIERELRKTYKYRS